VGAEDGDSLFFGAAEGFPVKFKAAAKPALLGRAVGALVLATLGFMWGSWVTASSADGAAKQRAEAAVVTALTPICLAKFQANADVAVHLALLKKMNSWERGPYLERGGWANMPGGITANPGLARACAGQLDHDFVAE
jgi:hypothetical protein